MKTYRVEKQKVWELEDNRFEIENRYLTTSYQKIDCYCSDSQKIGTI